MEFPCDTCLSFRELRVLGRKQIYGNFNRWTLGYLPLCMLLECPQPLPCWHTFFYIPDTNFPNGQRKTALNRHFYALSDRR
jgi:hypothetical protein